MMNGMEEIGPKGREFQIRTTDLELDSDTEHEEKQTDSRET